MEWQQGVNEHYSDARIGDILRLKISPDIASGRLMYKAQVMNTTLADLRARSGFETIRDAQVWAAAQASTLLVLAHREAEEWLDVNSKR